MVPESRRETTGLHPQGGVYWAYGTCHLRRSSFKSQRQEGGNDGIKMVFTLLPRGCWATKKKSVKNGGTLRTSLPCTWDEA